MGETSVSSERRRFLEQLLKVSSRKGIFSRETWFWLLEPEVSWFAVFLAIFDGVLTLMDGYYILADSIPTSKINLSFWLNFEWLIGIFHTVDLVVRMIVSPGSTTPMQRFIRFFSGNFHNVVALFNVLPFLLYAVDAVTIVKPQGGTPRSFADLVWLMRFVLRPMRLARHFPAARFIFDSVRMSAEALMVPMYFLLVLVVSLASFIYYFERTLPIALNTGTSNTGVNSGFDSVFQAMYFAIVTVSTVGYGDFYPYTTEGRIVTSIFILSAVLYMAIPLSIVGGNFNSLWGKRDKLLTSEKMQTRLADLGISYEDLKTAFFVLAGAHPLIGQVGEVPKIVKERTKLDSTEFIEFVDLIGVGFSKNSTLKLFRVMDSDGNGCVSFAEFELLIYPDIAREELKEIQDNKEDADQIKRGSSSLIGSRAQSAEDKTIFKLSQEKEGKVHELLDALLQPLENSLTAQLKTRGMLSAGLMAEIPFLARRSSSDWDEDHSQKY